MSFAFTKNAKWFALPSVVVLLVALVMTLAGNGLNMGLDFTGGSLVTLEMGTEFDARDVEAAFAAQGITQVQVSKTGEGGVQHNAVVRMPDTNTPEQDSDARIAIVEALKAKYPGVVNTQTERVGGVAGAELVRNAVSSVALAGVLMLIYIWFRFEMVSGSVAIVALLHDVFIMVSFMVILRSIIQVNSSFIAAMLTIIGYSINNVIVIFDRIRENRRKYSVKDVNSAQLADRSIAETMTRTINTSLTTLVTIVLLNILGVPSIREFSLPIIIGLLAGVYSSVFLSAPLWAIWSEKLAARRALKKTNATTVKKQRKPARA